MSESVRERGWAGGNFKLIGAFRKQVQASEELCSACDKYNYINII